MTDYRVPRHLRRRTQALSEALAIYGVTADSFQVHSHYLDMYRWNERQIPLTELLEITGWPYRDASERHAVKWVTVDSKNRPHTGSVYAEADKDAAVAQSCFTPTVERLTYGVFGGRAGSRLIEAVDVSEEFARLRERSSDVIVCASCKQQRPKAGSVITSNGRCLCSSCRAPVEYEMHGDSWLNDA